MKSEKHQVVIVSGSHPVYGENIGCYPIHHFTMASLEERTDRQLPLYVVSCGDDDNNAGFWRERRDSTVYALELMVKGEFRFMSGNAVYQCLPGDLFIVHPGSNTRMECVSNYATKRTIVLGGSLHQPIMESLGLGQRDFIRLSNPAPVDAAFQEIDRAVKTRDSNLTTEISLRLYGLLVELSNQVEQLKYPPRLYELLNYLERHISEPIRMRDLAAFFHLNERTIFGLFQRHLGCSPTEHLIAIRMSRAKLLLRERRHRIKHIADLVGYNNQLYFSSEFHRRVGCTPSEYIRQISQSEELIQSEGKSSR